MKTSVGDKENKRENKIYGKKWTFISSIVTNLRGALKRYEHSEEIKGISPCVCYQKEEKSSICMYNAHTMQQLKV
jgi:hypothetical protein